MKNIYILFISVLLFACRPQGDKAIIITGELPEGVNVTSFWLLNGMDMGIYQDSVNADGSFRFEYESDVPCFLGIESDNYKYKVKFFARPGDHQQVFFRPDGSVEFSGNGAENNRFAYQLAVYKMRLNRERPLSYTSVDSVVKGIREHHDQLLDFIGKAELKDTEFVEMLKLSGLQTMYTSLFNLNTVIKLVTSKDTLLPPDFYAFAMEFRANQPELRYLPFTNKFLQNYFSVLETNGYLKSGLTDFLAKRGELIGDAVARENYLLFALNEELKGYNQQLPEVISSVQQWLISDKAKRELEQIVDKQVVLAEKYSALRFGNIALDFAGGDKKGNRYSLADYKGKTVVVDVWSTNCMPCIAELPYLWRLEDQFADEEVVFVSYSVDFDFDKWINFIEQRKMGGIQLVDTLGPKSVFVQNYLIHSTPRMLIIDKQGKIVDTFAPKPSDPRLALKIRDVIDSK